MQRTTEGIAESHKYGIENALEGIKAGENDQLEETSTESNSFGNYDDNEGENFDDEKYYRTLSDVSVNSNES